MLPNISDNCLMTTESYGVSKPQTSSPKFPLFKKCEEAYYCSEVVLKTLLIILANISRFRNANEQAALDITTSMNAILLDT